MSRSLQEIVAARALLVAGLTEFEREQVAVIEGRNVARLGELWARQHGLDLRKSRTHRGHDGVLPDGRTVEVKSNRTSNGFWGLGSDWRAKDADEWWFMDIDAATGKLAAMHVPSPVEVAGLAYAEKANWFINRSALKTHVVARTGGGGRSL